MFTVLFFFMSNVHRVSRVTVCLICTVKVQSEVMFAPCMLYFSFLYRHDGCAWDIYQDPERSIHTLCSVSFPSFRAIILLFFPFYFSILYTHTCFIAIANCPLVIIESSIIPLWVCAQLCQDFFLNKTVYMCEYQHQKTFASSLKAQLKYEKCI